MNFRQLPCPNFNERRDGKKPSMIILHYTGTQTAQEAEDVWMKPDSISPHYMIDGDGVITQYVDESKRAWHAGKGSWENVTDINSASIGIEIWNTGHEYLLEDFKEAQINRTIELIRDIRTRHVITDDYILAHSDTAPGRKIDPGEKFPWGRLAEAGIGLMPQVQDEDRTVAENWLDEPDEILTALQLYGYDPHVDPVILMKEFRRHFLPETLNQWGADMVFCSALAALLRQKRQVRFDRAPSSDA